MNYDKLCLASHNIFVMIITCDEIVDVYVCDQVLVILEELSSDIV